MTIVTNLGCTFCTKQLRINNQYFCWICPASCKHSSQMKSFLSFSLTDLLSFFLSLCRVISLVSFTLSLRVPSPERRREGKQNENGFFKRRKNPLPAEEGTFCLALPEALPEVRNIPYGKILVSHMKKVMRNQVILM